jgi:hypothetical protein
MATETKVSIIVAAEDRASSVLTGIQGRINAMQPAFRKMAIGGAAAFAAISAGTVVMVKNASDLEESINAVTVVFEEGANKILEFAKTASTSVGMTESAFNQMSTQTGALLKDTGLSADEVAEKTINLTKRAADMASVFNTDVDDAMSAINQALRGETEAIRRYAGDVTDATLETYALSVGINKSVAEMTQQEKRLLRVDLIMKQTAVTQGDFINTSDSLANRQRILAATITDLSAKIGATLIPIIQDLLNKLTPIIESFTKWIDQNPELAKYILIAALALTGLIAVVGTLGMILPAIIGGVVALKVAVIALCAHPVILAIVALTTALVDLYTAWEKTKEVMGETTESGKGAMEAAKKLDPLIEQATGERKAKLIKLQEETMAAGTKATGYENMGFFESIAKGINPAELIKSSAPTALSTFGGPIGQGIQNIFNFNGDVSDIDSLKKAVVGALNREAQLRGTAGK